MQRLSRIAEGDPESTRYGLDLDLAQDSTDEGDRRDEDGDGIR
jgi:hypothetical protein